MGELDRLLERANAFDREALGEIYDTFHPKIYRYIFARVGNGSLAEDLAGEVFLRMLEGIRRGSEMQNSLSGWLYRVAHNLVVDHYRAEPPDGKAPNEEELVSDSENPGRALEDALHVERLRSAIIELTEDQQKVVVLKFVEGMRNSEIADVLGKTEGAVKSLQHRALASLTRLLVERG